MSLPFIIALNSKSKGQSVSSAPDQNKSIAIVLDNSGSMKKNDPGLLTKKVVANFLTSTDKNTQISILLFDTDVKMLMPLIRLDNDSIINLARQKLDKIDYKGQYTDIPGAVERAIYELKNDIVPGSEKAVILLTDGFIDTGDATRDSEKSEWLRNSLTKEAEAGKIKIFGIAFTENADYQLMQELAQKTGAGYYRALKPEDIQPVFKKVYEKISMPEKQVIAEPEPDLIEPDDHSGRNMQIIIIAGFLIVAVIAIIVLVKILSNRPAPVIVREGALSSSGTHDIANQLPVPAARLIDIKNISGKSEFTVRKSKTSVGREEANDFVLSEKTISGYHASIIYRDRDKSFFIVDHNSSNHTYLNGKELKAGKEVMLRDNDEVRFDTYPFQFVIPLPAPKTVLSSGKDKEKTVLRPKDEKEKIKDKTPEKKVAAPIDNNEEERETVLKQNFCPNHPAVKVTELCPVCKKAYCKVCMVEKDGKMMCKACGEETEQMNI